MRKSRYAEAKGGEHKRWRLVKSFSAIELKINNFLTILLVYRGTMKLKVLLISSVGKKWLTLRNTFRTPKTLTLKKMAFRTVFPYWWEHFFYLSNLLLPKQVNFRLQENPSYFD
jgi:hypothetical protein